MAYRSRERVARILAHQEADRVPYCAIGGGQITALVDTMPLAPDHRTMCLEGDIAQVVIEPPSDMAAFRPFLGDIPAGVEASYWGIGRRAIQTAEGYHAGHQMFYPLARVDTIEGLRAYPFPDVAGSGADIGLEQRVAELQAAGYTVMGQMSQTILETAYSMRGIGQLMLDLYERPAYVETLFAAIAERRLFQARRFAEANVDILRIGDDIATQRGLMIGAPLYRQRIKPFHAAIIAEARRIRPRILVKYHSDGNLTALLPDLIDAGVNIINPVQPECMDLLRIKHEFGRDLTLWGCLPGQSVYAHGAGKDVVNHLRWLMEHIAPGGGLVAKFTNFLLTERSLANLGVFFQTFYELGRYA